MSIKTIDSKTLKTLLDNNEAVVIDVREMGEYEAENIPGAKLIPLSKICKEDLYAYKDKKIIIHCQAGTRGGKACQKLLSEDPNLEIYNLEGGITAWRQFGGKINKAKKFFLSLDRQVQLTIGLGVFIGSALGYFLDPLFFLLSGFFGAGLIFAGASGTCGLAMLMAKMPWNKSNDQSIISSCSIKRNN